MDALKKLPWHNDGQITQAWCLHTGCLAIWLGRLDHEAMPAERQVQLKQFFIDAGNTYTEAYHFMQDQYRELKRLTYDLLVQCAEESASLDTLERRLQPVLPSVEVTAQFQTLLGKGRHLYEVARKVSLDLVQEFHDEVALDGVVHNDQGKVVDTMHFVVLPVTSRGKKERLFRAMLLLHLWIGEINAFVQTYWTG